jgi:hypothetical protein
MSPSIPPANMTWPMVAYAFVRELPYTMMVACGALVAYMLVMRGGSSAIEEISAVVVPAIVSALARSKPPEVLSGGAGALELMIAKNKIGM